MKLKPQTAFLTLVAIAGAIVLSTVFFITGYAVGEKAGFEGVKERLVGYLPTSTNSAKSLDGTVKEVRDGTLVMTTGTVSANPLDAQGPSERSIKVNASTKISESTPKTSVQMKAEQDAYHEAVSKGQVATPPAPYAVTTLTLGDLKAGDSIRVGANENIYYANSFIATTVERLK